MEMKGHEEEKGIESKNGVRGQSTLPGGRRPEGKGGKIRWWRVGD